MQDVFTPTDKLVLTLSARVDSWRNYDAHNLETNVPAGTPTPGNRPTLPDTEDTVGSPRVAALYHVTDRVTAWGDVSWGFRAPTLNELYRQFRVGAMLTLRQRSARARAADGRRGRACGWQPIDNLTIRTTWFDNRVKNPVSNVTHRDRRTPSQQRQNLGRTRIWGLQNDVEYRLADVLARRRRVSLQPGEGRRSSPRTRRSSASSCRRCRSIAGRCRCRTRIRAGSTSRFGVQFIGRQFDDDLNVRAVPGESEPGLPGYAIVDFTVSRALVRNFDVFLGVQNLFDEEYFVGTLPTTIGSPRLVHGGVRVRFAGR